MHSKIWLFAIIALVISSVCAQTDDHDKKLKFNGDFRFRVEHDWNSKNADGDLRNDRSRLRYRFRFGMTYQLNEWASFGGRMRSGNINDQQGPHVTLGGGNGEFNLTQIGLEKLFFKFEKKHLKGWVGKNSLLAMKQNELFWNDNVFPEGVALNFNKHFETTNYLNSLNINLGHYIINSNNDTFDEDSYFQLLQVVTRHFDSKLSVFPGFYYFKDVANIPDRQGTYTQSYAITHVGVTGIISKKPFVSLGADYYANVEDYSANDSIPSNFKNDKRGIVLSAKMGRLQKKGDWIVQLYYAYLEKYAIVDYFAQNDWARWDYTSQDAFGARLTNMKGIEFKVGYAFDKNFSVNVRTYFVRQIKAEGAVPETGNRIRLDLDIRM